MKHYHPFKHTRDRRGCVSFAMEDLWDAVGSWAEREGFTYEPTYGVIGVAAT